MSNNQNNNQANLTPNFDLTSFKKGNNYALEASAGTGKTFNIVEIVKKLVYKEHIGLDKILIVTYTEKAAGELKDRIRTGLTTLDSQYNVVIKDAVGDSVNCDVDNASIGTIHSFCKNTISEFAISSNQPTNLDLAGDNSIVTFANQYIREGEALKDISFLLQFGHEVNIENLIKSLVLATKSYYLNSSNDEDPGIIVYKPTYNESAQTAFAMSLSDDPIKELEQLSPTLYGHYCVLKQSTKQTAIDFVALFEDFQNFASDARTSKEFGFTKANGLDKAEIDAFKALFKELKTPFITDGYNKFRPNNYIIDRHLKKFYIAYQEYKEKNRQQSFNDMLRMVRESDLEPNSKQLECLRNKYTYGIIDEFQDTNQIQFDVFKKVFMCDGHNIIVVGDPKQSIYAFQGADVFVYENAVNEIVNGGGIKRRLAKNYRSSAAVVEFGNVLFPKFFDKSFEPSDYCLAATDNKEKRLLYDGKIASGLWFNEGQLSSDEYARFAVEQILDCTSIDDNGNTRLQKQYFKKGVGFVTENVDFSDFVILAKAKREMEPIQRALKSSGIPYIRYKDDTLFKGYECEHWIAILEAIDANDFTGSNRGYFRKALFTKFFNKTLKEISKPIYDSDELKEIQMFNDWRELAKKELWEDLFDAIILDTDLDNNLSSITERPILVKLKQIANYAIDYLSNGHNISELIDKLKDLQTKASSDGDDEDASLVAKSTEFKSVRIMTMHASKGLQFPVVISVGTLISNPDSSASYTYHAETDQVDAQGNKTKQKVVSIEKSKDEVNNEEDAEALRLFYVAYTRSEYLLIAPQYTDGKLDCVINKTNSFINEYDGKTFDYGGQKIKYFEFKSFKDKNYSYLKDITEKTLKRLSDEEKAINPPDGDIDEQMNAIQSLKGSKYTKFAYKHSYSTLAHPKEDEKEEIEDEIVIIDKDGSSEEQTEVVDANAKQIEGTYNSDADTLEIPDGYPKGAGMGNAIHEVFERLDFTNPEDKLDELILERFLANGFDISKEPTWIEYTKNIVRRVLSASLPVVKGSNKVDGSFKLSELTNDNKKPEAEFNFNYPGQELFNYLNGFIDLLFKRGDVYSILDWKSDVLNDQMTNYGKPDELKIQVDNRYSIQRVIYSYCLIKWLKLFYDGSEEEIFNNHFGGIYYVFVRGCHEDTSNGVYIQTWDSWNTLEQEFRSITHTQKKGDDK